MRKLGKMGGGGKRARPNFIIPRHSHGGTEEKQKKTCQNGGSPSQDLNPESAKYEAEELSTKPWPWFQSYKQHRVQKAAKTAEVKRSI
jgi:hypothetical protein